MRNSFGGLAILAVIRRALSFCEQLRRPIADPARSLSLRAVQKITSISYRRRDDDRKVERGRKSYCADRSKHPGCNGNHYDCARAEY